MNFEPFDINEETSIQPGNASFEIISNKDAISKSGKEMMVVSMKVWDANGTEGILNDYLLPSVTWKLKNFLKSIKKEELADAGIIKENSLEGLSGTLRIKKEVNEKYGTNMKVSDYINEEKKEVPFDDPLPF